MVLKEGSLCRLGGLHVRLDVLRIRRTGSGDGVLILSGYFNGFICKQTEYTNFKKY